MEKVWKATAEVDRALRAVYESNFKPTTIRQLGKKLGWPQHQLQARASFLGLTKRQTFTPWADAEKLIVANNIEHSVSHIVKRLRAEGFIRTEQAVCHKIKHMRALSDRNCFSAHGLALLMGVHARTVLGWINRGQLHARRRHDERTEQQGGSNWLISPGDVRRFVRQHPMAFDIRKVDQLWFVDLVFNSELDTQKGKRKR